MNRLDDNKICEIKCDRCGVKMKPLDYTDGSEFEDKKHRFNYAHTCYVRLTVDDLDKLEYAKS